MDGQDGGIHLSLNSKTWPFYDRICENARSTKNIESLPDDLLWEILVLIPADVLYHRASLVCRSWYNMIRSPAFVKVHLEQGSTNYGLLLSYDDGRLMYVNVTKQGHIEISKLDWKCRIFSSCNGLVLGTPLCSRSNSRSPSFILNLATNKAALFESEGAYSFMYSIAYAAPSMVYKVVHQRLSESSAIRSISRVGLDNSWRFFLHSPSDARDLLPFSTSLITDGYIHWVWALGTEKVLTMNVETEIITETNIPLPRTDSRFYLSTGRYLTLLVSRVDYVWNVWEMKPAESGEWKRLRYNIKFEAQQLHQLLNCDCEDHEDQELLQLVWPVGWVKYPEFLVFCFAYADIFIFYNLRTHQICSTAGVLSSDKLYRAFPHRKTLVRLS